MSGTPHWKRMKNDNAENVRVTIIMIIFLSLYAALASFVLTNAA